MTFAPFSHRALRVSNLAKLATNLTEEEVVAQWGRSFFLIHTHASAVTAFSRTGSFEGVETGDPTQPVTTGLEMVALPITRRPGSHNDVITVGRLDGNDVCILDMTISKFHAFLVEDAFGRLLLTDAGSKNGTRVNGMDAPRRDADPGCVAIGVGDTVTFGSVSALVEEAAGLLALAREFRSSAGSRGTANPTNR